MDEVTCPDWPNCPIYEVVSGADVIDPDVYSYGDAAEDLISPCQNKCELGQILCTTDTRYKSCAMDDEGCLGFVGATVFCTPETICICSALGPNNWCDPGDDAPCICVPDCVGKACGPDGCGGSCGSCPPGSICDLSTGVCL